MLIIVSCYVAYRIIREIIDQKKCPSDRELKDVALGITKKNTARADRVIMHLGICEKCQEKVSEIGSE